MKTVKSKADLTRLAVGRGATVKLASGELLNAGKERAKLAKPSPPSPPSPPPKQEEKEDDTLALAVLHLADQQTELIQAISRHLEKVPAPPSYEFDLKRDENGFLKVVVAKPL